MKVSDRTKSIVGRPDLYPSFDISSNYEKFNKEAIWQNFKSLKIGLSLGQFDYAELSVFDIYKNIYNTYKEAFEDGIAFFITITYLNTQVKSRELDFLLTKVTYDAESESVIMVMEKRGQIFKEKKKQEWFRKFETMKWSVHWKHKSIMMIIGSICDRNKFVGAYEVFPSNSAVGTMRDDKVRGLPPFRQVEESDASFLTRIGEKLGYTVKLGWGQNKVSKPGHEFYQKWGTQLLFINPIDYMLHKKDIKIHELSYREYADSPFVGGILSYTTNYDTRNQATGATEVSTLNHLTKETDDMSAGFANTDSSELYSQNMKDANKYKNKSYTQRSGSDIFSHASPVSGDSDGETFATGANNPADAQAALMGDTAVRLSHLASIEMKMVGNPQIEPLELILFYCPDAKDAGFYIVTEIEHTIDSNGYITILRGKKTDYGKDAKKPVLRQSKIQDVYYDLRSGKQFIKKGEKYLEVPEDIRIREGAAKLGEKQRQAIEDLINEKKGIIGSVYDSIFGKQPTDYDYTSYASFKQAYTQSVKFALVNLNPIAKGVSMAYNAIDTYEDETVAESITRLGKKAIIEAGKRSNDVWGGSLIENVSAFYKMIGEL